MKNPYTPEKLNICLQKVKETHQTIGDLLDDNVSDASFLAVLKRIEKMTLSEAAIEASVMSVREIAMLCYYLPENKFNIEAQSNICAIVKQRASIRNLEILVNQWQNHFSNRVCNTFLSLLTERDEYFQETLKKKHIYDQNLLKWLHSDDISKAVAKCCYDDDRSLDISDKITGLGLDPKKTLGKEAQRQFYLICRADDYLRAGDEMLVSLLHSYTDEEFDEFLQNIVSELSDEELDSLRLLTEEVWKRTKLVKQRQHHMQITDESHLLNRKLQGWMNGFQMEKMFAVAENGNRRLQFWYRFRKDAVYVYHDERRSLLKMEFQSVMVIEFCEVGPMYFFNRQLFNEKIEPHMPRTNKNRAIADYLLHSFGSSCIDRIEHRGYWERNARTALRYHNILGGNR